jgi:uncharacterized membrane protein
LSKKKYFLSFIIANSSNVILNRLILIKFEYLLFNFKNHEKKSVLIYLLTICSLLINAQVHLTETTGVLAPDGASQIDGLPVTIGTFAQYTYSQTIYTAQQINASGDIDSFD